MLNCVAKFFRHKTKRNQNKEAAEIIVSVFIIAMLLMTHTEISEKWEQFKKRIINNGIHTKDAEIEEAIISVLDKAVYMLRRDERVYRARIIVNSELPKETKEFLETRDGVLQLISAYELTGALADFVEGLFGAELNRQSGGIDKYKHDRLWGFNKKQSDVPPKDKAKAGRTNTKGVPYLYAAEDSHTAVTEVRPIIGQMVSVAQIKINKELRLFDFCAVSPFNNEDTEIEHLLRMIAREFSMPNHNKEEDYLPTQCVANLIKNSSFKFDGIRFPSSLHEGGINIVLFDTNVTDEKGTYVDRNYCIESTALHLVKNITIEEKQILPIEL